MSKHQPYVHLPPELIDTQTVRFVEENIRHSTVPFPLTSDTLAGIMPICVQRSKTSSAPLPGVAQPSRKSSHWTWYSP